MERLERTNTQNQYFRISFELQSIDKYNGIIKNETNKLKRLEQ